MNSSFPIRLWNLWLVALGAMLVFLGGAMPAQAQISRAFAARYSGDLRGDIILTGNTVIRPTSTTVSSNNSTPVQYADVDGNAATINSSSAQLKLPLGLTGSSIVWARLYWSGRLTATSLPATQTVQFSANGSAAGYQTYTATQNSPSAAQSQLTNFAIPGYNGMAYSAWADVTAQMKTATALPTLLAGGLSGDLINDGLGGYAGWTVIAVYRQSSDFVRQLRVFDGLGIVNGTNALPITLSGFRTPDSGAFTMRFGSLVNEGDKGIVGDALQFNGTPLSDAVNPANDYFNSTVSQDGVLFNTELNPVPSNGTIFGMDADRTNLMGPSAQIGAGATSANLNFTTSGDVYFPTAFTTSIPTFEIQGRVFEDPNYSGGAGRAFDTAKGMAGAVGATVELYNTTTNTYVKSTTTDANGFYYFYTLGVGNYAVRVVNSTVKSTRAGGAAATGLLPVQTYRTDASTTIDANGSGTVAPVTNQVGGAFPNADDAAASITLLPTGAQSVARVVLGDSAVANVDFGFNFDSIVNTRDSGQGSLRQFIANSNTLGNTGLAQETLTAGVESSIFMIPSTGDPLGRTADPNFANGVAKITLASGLTITGTNATSTAIDGTRQTANIGDTNAGAFGTGGSVGVQNVALPTLNRPEIEITGARGTPVGLDIAAGSALVRGVSIWGFGAAGDTNTDATIRVGADGTANFAPPTITQVLLGTSAVPGTGGALTIPATYGSGDLIRANGVDGGVVSNSILGFGGGKGVALQGGADGWTVQGNEIRGNSRDSANWDGVDAQVAGTQILENLIYSNGGVGIDSFSSTGGATIRNNTSRNNGVLCTPTTGESAGIRSFGTGNTILYNIVANNYGAGVLVQPGATSLISRNSISGNGDSGSGQIGIDLLSASDNIDRGTAPFVTPNDAGDGDAGANGLLNFPVITGFSVSGGQVTLSGFAPAGSTVEVFVAAPDPSGFGEGQTFAFSFVEGSGTDTDAGTGSYSASTLQALGYSAAAAALAGSETTANRFRVTVTAGSVSSNSLLTATATIGSATSEFSAVTGAINSASISGAVYLDTNSNARLDNGEIGATLTGFFIKLVPNGATAASTAVAVNNDGTYTIAGVAAGNYSLVLDNNATLSDIAPTVPAGYSATEAPGGTRPVAFGNTSVTGQNFGLYAGYTLSGKVFEDNGLGGGIANDGLQNGTEPNIGGVNLQLKSGATVLATATTAADGTYSFSVPGTSSGQTLSVVETNLTSYVSSGASVGNTGGTYNRTTDTVSFAFNTANGTLSGVNFADVRGATLDNDGNKVGTRGGSVVYPHVFTANTAGSVVFSLVQNATPAPGWSVALYNDLNGNGTLDPNEPQINSTTGPIATTASGKINLLIINYVPQNAPDGSQDKITLTANFTPSVGGTNAALPTQTLTRGDLTTVGPQSGLSLSKAVDRTTAKSGDLITYTLTYTNIGDAPISNLVINDTTPAFTTFSSATYTQPLSSSLTGCTIAAPTVGASGAIAWTFTGTLAQGATGTVTFVVRLN